MRWRLIATYMLIIGIAFYAVAASLIQLVADYMFDQRVRQQQTISERLAIRAAADMENQDAESLYAQAVSASRSYGGRVLILDAYGTVQVDAFSALNGTRLNNPEVISVLTGEQSNSFGFYKQTETDMGWLLNLVGLDDGTLIYGLYASSIIANDRIDGVLLYATNEAELYDRLKYMQTTMIYWLIGVALVTMLLSIFASRMLTRPVKKLREGINYLSIGDFSHQVDIKGHSEYAQLAAAFNMMSKKLEQLDRTRSQFVSNASHELKTPLATMKILIESIMSQEEFEPNMTREFLNDTDHEIDRLTALINDLLTLVRMDSGEMRLKLNDIHVDELLAEIVRRLTPLAKNRNIDITLDSYTAPVIEGDENKLRQVFYNLVDNAIKYTPIGGKVGVEISEDVKYAIIRVKDTGIGIPKADQEHIFDRFYRVDKARSRETGGTGLGLSIVSQIVALHSGTIKVESEEDKGSVFTVMLPK